MTTFPTSQRGRLPPIINGTAGEEIVAECYTVNLQLNLCHESAAEKEKKKKTPPPLQKVIYSDVKTFCFFVFFFLPSCAHFDHTLSQMLGTVAQL